MRRLYPLILLGALGLLGLGVPIAAARAEGGCRRVTEGEIRVATLILLAREAGDCVAVTRIVDELEAIMAPCGADMERATNGETLFEKKIRKLSIREHRTSLQVQGLAEYVRCEDGAAGWRILTNGICEVEHWRQWIDLDRDQAGSACPY